MRHGLPHSFGPWRSSLRHPSGRLCACQYGLAGALRDRGSIWSRRKKGMQVGFSVRAARPQGLRIRLPSVSAGPDLFLTLSRLVRLIPCTLGCNPLSQPRVELLDSLRCIRVQGIFVRPFATRFLKYPPQKNRECTHPCLLQSNRFLRRRAAVLSSCFNRVWLVSFTFRKTLAVWTRIGRFPFLIR